MLDPIAKWISIAALMLGVALIPQGCSAPDSKAGTPLLEFRIAADRAHDAKVVEQALKADGWKKPPEGYRWVPYDPRGRNHPNLIVRPADEAENGVRESLLVRTDTETVTEKDLLSVRKSQGDDSGPIIMFRLSPAGAERFGTLTREHLPTEGGTAKYHVAIIVEGVSISAPSIDSEIRDSGVIDLGREAKPEEADHLVKMLGRFANPRTRPMRAKEVNDQAEAIREANATDLPALAEADRFTISAEPLGPSKGSNDPKEFARLRQALKPEALPPSGGMKAASVSFYRGDTLIRKLWVYEGGEWGFERLGTGWTTGGSPELWAMIREYLSK